jgi:hypothetical protein
LRVLVRRLTAAIGAAPTEPGSGPGTGAEAGAENNAIRLRDGIGFATRVFVAVWFGWALLSLIGVLIIPAGTPVGVPGLDAEPHTAGWHNILTSGHRADALWYQRIGADGYTDTDSSAAFFPLYPLAIFVLTTITGLGIFPAALIVAQAAYFGTLVVMYGLTRRELGAENARRATRYLAVFPTAFFFLVPYTESLFLLLVLLTFWYARGNRWWLAVLPAALAGLTRSAGIVLVAALAIEAVEQWRKSGRSLAPRLVASLAPAAGIGSYFAYWSVVHGSLMAPVDAQKNWQKEWMWPPETLWEATASAWKYQSYWLIDLVVVLIPLVATLAGVRMIPLSYTAYAVGSLLLPLSNAFAPRPLMSTPRYVLVLFPAFWVIALAVQRKWFSHSLVIGGFAGGFALLGLLFVNSYAIF